MIDYLYHINKWSLGIELAALIIYILSRTVHTPKSHKNSAFPWIAIGMCLTSIMHMAIEAWSKSLWADPANIPLANIIWYFGYAASDFIFVSLSVLVCIKAKLKRDLVSNFILVAFTILGFMQLIRFTDRYILDIDLFGGVYSIGIVFINVLTLTGILFFVGHFVIHSLSARLRGVA